MIPGPLPDITAPQRHPGPAASPLLRAGFLVVAALPVLVVSGLLGRMVWAPVAPPPPHAGAPQVWIASLILPDPPAMAALGDDLPTPAQRITAALPPGSVASAPLAGASAGPVTVPQSSAAQSSAPQSLAPQSLSPPFTVPVVILTPAEAPPGPSAGWDDPAVPTLTARAVMDRPARTGAQTDAPPIDRTDTRPGVLSDARIFAPGAAPVASPVTSPAPAQIADPIAGHATLTAPGLLRSPYPPTRPTRVTALALAARTAPEVVGTVPQVATALSTAPLQAPRPSARPAAVARLAAVPPSVAALTAPQPTAAALAVPPLTDRADGCGPSLTRAIPRRPAGAEGGRAAMARLAGAGGTTRDAAIIRTIEGGNVPDHLRATVPVTLSGTDTNGRRAQITLCVMPDYLAVGSDRDFVRVPMGLPAASRLAERFDMVLPTARMVDAIHAQARVRLAPSPMTPGAQMASTDYFIRHNATVETQRSSRSAPLGALVSGHKKDLVITNRLSRVAGRVAIYGWHRANGQPIQPLSTVHGQNYADYSHGIRLISRTAFLNGRAVDLRDLLADGRYAGLLTGEGPIATRTLLAALR